MRPSRRCTRTVSSYKKPVSDYENQGLPSLKSTFRKRELNEVGEDRLCAVVRCSFGKFYQTKGVCDDGEIGRDLAKAVDLFLRGRWVLLVLQRLSIYLIDILLRIGLILYLDGIIGGFTGDYGIGDVGFAG